MTGAENPQSGGQSFFWGVATSGYQSEGGFNQPGLPHNNWAEWEIRGRVRQTGKGPDFWNRFPEDLALCSGMGLNAFRMGIEWSRVQPSFDVGEAPPPDWDRQAIADYADRLAACRNAGLEPVLTLHHFTHPAWLGIDAWLEPSTVDHFERYVSETVAALNSRLINNHGQAPLGWFITLNEPNILVLNSYMGRQFPARALPGTHSVIKAYNHLLAAHVRAYNVIHAIYEREGWPRPMVSLNTFCSDLYWNDKFIWDLLALRERGIPRKDLKRYLKAGEAEISQTFRSEELPFQKSFFWHLGQGAKWLANRMGRKLATPENFSTFLCELENSACSTVFDFVGLDYYDPFFGHLFRLPTFHDLEFPAHGLREWLMDGMTAKWWNWRSLPQGIRLFSDYYSRSLNGRPVLIAENGMAMRKTRDNKIVSTREDGLSRSEFLTAHVNEILAAVKAGVPIVGYLHWSLTDNYEWGSFTPRFGLYSLDYQNNASRLAIDQHGDEPSATYRKLIANARALF